MNKQQKIKLTFLFILLFLSLYLEWFRLPEQSISLKGIELVDMNFYLISFLIIGLSSVWIDIKGIHILGLISLAMFISIQCYEFFNWYVNLTAIVSMLEMSLSLTKFGFYVSVFIVFICFIIYLQYIVEYQKN